MKLQRTNQSVKLWLSPNDTYNWAHKTSACWPCSFLSNKRLFVEYDSNGDLVDIAVNGKTADFDATELNAIVADFVPQTGIITLNI